MKKLALMFLGLALSASVFAQQRVTILWPFNFGSNQANYVRAITEEANKQQNKYLFIFENKPGAGGTIAARTVADSKDITLLSMSSSFYLRPLFYPNESYDVDRFRAVYTECTGQPVSIISAKFKSFNELKNQQRITIGIVSGGITELTARELAASLPKVQVDLVPYQGSVNATNDVLAGVLDLSVEFAGDAAQWAESGKLNVIGITGTRSYPMFPTFGLEGFNDLVSAYQIMAPAGLSTETAKELHTIFTNAAKNNAKLEEFYKRDFCQASQNTFSQTELQFQKWRDYWAKKMKK